MVPNIVYILADDMGYGDVSCYNPNCKAITPCLDQLAGEGMRFSDSHTSSAVCTPIVPMAEYRGRTDIGLYGDFVTQIDAIVSEVLAALERNGLTENTLVIFTSDNGASPAARLDELKAAGHEANWPWRGAKADLYEGGHRVPFIARWPGVVLPGTVCDQTPCTTDLLATVAGIVGQALPSNAGEDSHDLLPLLRGERGGERAFREATVHHSVSGHFAIRRGKWKLLEARGSGGWSYSNEEEGAALGLPEVQLYDMERDPGETTNVACGHPEVVSELREMLERYRAGVRTAPVG